MGEKILMGKERTADQSLAGDAVSNRRQEIRREMKRLRRELAGEERIRMDRAILTRLLDEESSLLSLSGALWRRSGEVIYCYASHGSEADTHALLRALWEREIPVALPRVEAGDMNFYLTGGREDLNTGYQGIWEPRADLPPALGRPGPVITPGLAFGADGSRIGYGGGYYDRFFAREPDHARIAIAYPFQIWESLPCETWDQKVDRIVTEDRVICCGRLRGDGNEGCGQVRKGNDCV